MTRQPSVGRRRATTKEGATRTHLPPARRRGSKSRAVVVRFPSLRRASTGALLALGWLLAAGCGRDKPQHRPSEPEILRELHAKIGYPQDHMDSSTLDGYDPESDDGEFLACSIVSYWHDVNGGRQVVLDSGWTAMLVCADNEPPARDTPAGAVRLWDCSYSVGVTGLDAKVVYCVAYLVPPE